MEFIVWDKKSKEFMNTITDIEIVFQESLVNGFTVIKNYPYDCESLDADIFQYIGKTDINNKKIYADCSVVEFSYINCDEEHIVKAYFTWDEEYLKYILDPIQGYNSTIEYEPFKFLNMKIIDTIQENKLGLIK